MGVRASLTEIARKFFDEFLQGGEPKLDGELHFIDKDWFYLHEVFKGSGEPLCRVIAGDVLLPQCPQSFDEFSTGGHDYYVSFMSPELVQQIAVASANLSDSVLNAWCEAVKVYNYDIQIGHFETLKTAYTQASQRGVALFICIA